MPKDHITSDDVARKIRDLTKGDPTRLVSGIGSLTTPATSGSGSTTPPTSGFVNPMTVTGAMIRGGSGGSAVQIVPQTDGMILRLVSGIPAWDDEASGGSVDSVNGQTGTVVLDADDIADTATNVFASPAELTKLGGIEALADVTDAVNVEAAGAVMESDTTTAAMTFVIDEDSMASNLATKVPTQQSVKAYVDAQIGGIGGYTDEQARDAIGTALVAGSGITVTPDDALDTITIASTVSASDGDRMLTKRLMQWMADPGSTGVSNYTGFSLGSSVGGTRTNADDNDGFWVKFETASASTSDVTYLDFNIGSPVYKRSFLPDLTYRVKSGPVVTNIRWWVGMFSGDPSGSGAPTNKDFAAFRYDTGVDGTAFWRCVTDDQPNAVSSPTTTTTGVAIAVDTLYNLRIDMDASAVRFYINSALVATHTTNLPALNTGLAPRCELTNLSAAVHSFRASNVKLFLT